MSQPDEQPDEVDVPDANDTNGAHEALGKSSRTPRRRGALRWLPWTIVALMLFVGLFAPLLANDVPLVAKVDGTYSFPAFADLIGELKKQGLGIFLISHDIHDVMELCDRASVMKNGQLVGTVNIADVTDDDLLSMIILGKNPMEKADA